MCALENAALDARRPTSNLREQAPICNTGTSQTQAALFGSPYNEDYNIPGPILALNF